MPYLHELFDAATDSLPPLPDLAPSARRIVRRRQLAARTTAAVLSSALVVGAGTFALSAQHPGRVQDPASQAAHTYDAQYVLNTLRGLWPIKSQQLKLDNTSPYRIVILQDGQVVGQLLFEVNPDVDKFPDLLVCAAADAADGSCITGTASDGDHVLADDHLRSVPIDVAPSGLISKTVLAGSGQSASATPSAGSASSIAQSALLNAQRLHGSYLGRLTVLGLTPGHASLPSSQQLLDLAKSPAFEQLVVHAVAAGSLQYLGTPPAWTATPTVPPTGVPPTVPATTAPATTMPPTLPATTVPPTVPATTVPPTLSPTFPATTIPPTAPAS